MKRILVATLSTLVLSTLVSPAKAIRPELLPQPIHPTISGKTVSAVPVEIKVEPSQKNATVSGQKTNSEMVQSQFDEKPSFEYFEKFYREKYGS